MNYLQVISMYSSAFTIYVDLNVYQLIVQLMRTAIVVPRAHSQSASVNTGNKMTSTDQTIAYNRSHKR